MLNFGFRALLVSFLVGVCALAQALDAQPDGDLLAEPLGEWVLPSGTELAVFGNASQAGPKRRDLVIWIPSEHGLREPIFSLIKDADAAQLAIWLPDFHDALMLPRGRRALFEIPVGDIVALVERAQAAGFEQVLLASAGRGAVLSLLASRAWQLAHPGDRSLVGLSLIHPHLIKGRPEPGYAADYRAVAYESNLPVLLVQPEFSTKFARTEEIAQVLSRGGSSVFVQPLMGVFGGFHARDLLDLKPSDRAEKAALPGRWAQVMRLFARLLSQPLAPSWVPQATAAPQSPGVVAAAGAGFREPRLHRFVGDPRPPLLRLPALSGEAVDLADFSGQVVLVNFWATWCGPCVEEIPSLSRLIERMSGRPFKVLTVNIGEPRSVIEDFVREIPVNFAILLDERGDAVRDWKVYAYPSNFLLDASGRIRFAYRGALDWDAPGIVAAIDELLVERD